MFGTPEFSKIASSRKKHGTRDDGYQTIHYEYKLSGHDGIVPRRSNKPLWTLFHQHEPANQAGFTNI